MLAKGQCYQISKARSCYQDLLPLLAACAGIYAAARIRISRSFQSNASDGFVIECKHLDACVVLPLHGPIEDAIQNKMPDGVGIGVLPGRLLEQATDEFFTPGFKSLFDMLIQPFLVNQYERNRELMFARHQNDRTKLPDSWQMAWIIRNGLSHNGKVNLNLKINPKPVNWRGLLITKENQDQEILGNFLNIGDLLVLSLDMEEAISGTIATVPMVQAIG